MEQDRVKPQILLVEDDAAVRNLIRTALEAHDYRVAIAETGEAAILGAASKNPDLIMLDLGLPDMDGTAVIERVRSWSTAPIIVVSARTQDEDKTEALDMGADDYLTKPFSVNELLARVRASLRRDGWGHGDSLGSVYENGELRIDFAAGCAWLSGEALHLTPIEYRLLCVLARNTGKVLTRNFLLSEVWGGPWEGDVASLRVFMRSLRLKIEPDPSHPIYIQTHVGVGYQMLRV